MLLMILKQILFSMRIINIGGKSQSVFNFVKKYNPKIKGISAKKILGKKARINISMNINKFKRLIND